MTRANILARSPCSAFGIFRAGVKSRIIGKENRGPAGRSGGVSGTVPELLEGIPPWKAEGFRCGQGAAWCPVPVIADARNAENRPVLPHLVPTLQRQSARSAA